ncbi:MAG: GNAT family N-acetyltransferase [Thermoplasmata archaeon]
MITLANINDVDGITKLENVSYHNPFRMNEIMDYLLDPLSVILVDKDNDKLKGYVIASLDQNGLYISRITTSKQYQKQGVATALLNKLIELAKSHNLKYIKLHVRIGNKSAIKLYLKNKFKLAKIVPHYYIDTNEPALVLIRKI